MKQSLEQYAAANPQEKPPEAARQEKEQKTIQEREADIKTAYKRKEAVTEAIAGGEGIEIALYIAIDCIALLTNDPEYGKKNIEQLNEVYSLVAQQSMLVNEKEAAAQKLKEQQAEYLSKLQKTVEREAKKCSRIGYELNTLLREIETQTE